MSAHPTPVLLPGVLYVAGDRLACAKMRCAGQTALYSGRTIDGVVLRPITGRDVIEYASARPGFARVTCECGHLRAVFSMRDGLSAENVPSDREGTVFGMTLCYESAEPTPVSLRPCEPWCDSKDDHASQHPEDRTCWGPRTAVDLTLEEPDSWGELGWCYDRFEVIALRRPEHDVACVGLSHDGKGFEVALRASEARELAAALLEVAEVIEQGAQ